ncbi:hypothetical protein F4604DRAFT_1920318 [Suillus subluteus]|nr:hypothetical protein F4604DRAFT_1920318 [Suillus subluteus]
MEVSNEDLQQQKWTKLISDHKRNKLNEDPDLVDEGHVILQGRGCEVSDEDLQQQKWTKLISDHKQLAEMMHNMMGISIAPSIPISIAPPPPHPTPSQPSTISSFAFGHTHSTNSSRHASFSSFPTLTPCLWTHAFHKLLKACLVFLIPDFNALPLDTRIPQTPQGMPCFPHS